MKEREMLGGPSAIVREAQERFKRAQSWESVTRQRFLQDIRFANGDSANGYQWPDKYKREREQQQRPCLTINKVRQHNLLIINDGRQNKPGMAFRPAGNGATFEAAQMWSALAKKVEYQSNAQAIYDLASYFQVTAGWGFWRVVTDYVGDETFDQDIFIRPVPDPLAVYIDPDARQPDKSDMKWAFLFEDITRDEARARYGQDVPLSNSTLDSDFGWDTKDHVRVAEYFRVVEEEDELWNFMLQDQGQQQPDELTMRKSLIPQEVIDQVKDEPTTRKRDIKHKKVEWKFIIGQTVVEEKDWPGAEIPVIYLEGEETIIDGELDRKGHTRALLDPQRMYNYWSSSAVEYGALQTKTPWLASAESIEGYQTDWETANTENKALLIYNAFDDQGQPIPPPNRIQPPVPAPVALQGMQTADMEMMMVSGQYQNQMGEGGNERTGKAISERQRQGDKATYHYINNLAIAIRRTAKIIMEIVPKIYDTKRLISVMAEDGQSLYVQIDPQAQQSFAQILDQDGKVAQRILNPTIGKFDVYADVGPGYATRREEAFNAYTLILTQAPQLAAIIGDLMLQSGDFPLADEAAARLRRLVPPQALGQGPTQNEQQLQQQLQQLQGLYTKLLEQGSIDKLKLKGHAEKRDVDIYNAITKRLQVIAPALAVQPDALKSVVQEAIREVSKEGLEDASQAVGTELEGLDPSLAAAHIPPVPGAQKAPDGEWYLQDPIRKGKYLKVRHAVGPGQMQAGFQGANASQPSQLNLFEGAGNGQG